MHKRPATLIGGFVVAMATTAAAAADCTTGTALCLQDDRFLIEATWKKSDGTSGAGHPVALGSDSGYFWFLDSENVELAVKALDACSVNGHAWFFAGGLTNLEVQVSVTDSASGDIRSYTNPQGEAFRPITDTKTFPCPGGVSRSGLHPEEPRDDEPAILASPAWAERRAAPGCDQGESILCIDGRFRVEASWQAASGRTGVAHAVSLTRDSGSFWFFDPGNLELVVKTLDACGIRGGQWFFATGLTTLGVQLQVTDTLTGETRTYGNPLGVAFPPIQDTAAFAFCPPRTTTPTPTPAPNPPPTPTVTPTPAPTTPHTVSAGCARTPDPDIHPCLFLPGEIHISVGESVHWTLGQSASHSSTSGSEGLPDGNWDSGLNLSGYTHTFTQAGTFPYFCRVHQNRGTVFVDP